MTTEKKTRTPRNYESIEKGALALDLGERVDLKNRLVESISDELKWLEEQLKKATTIVNGNGTH